MGYLLIDLEEGIWMGQRIMDGLWKDGWMDGGRMNGWTNGWMEGWLDEWTDR